MGKASVLIAFVVMAGCAESGADTDCDCPADAFPAGHTGSVTAAGSGGSSGSSAGHAGNVVAAGSTAAGSGGAGSGGSSAGAGSMAAAGSGGSSSPAGGAGSVAAGSGGSGGAGSGGSSGSSAAGPKIRCVAGSYNMTCEAAQLAQVAIMWSVQTGPDSSTTYNCNVESEAPTCEVGDTCRVYVYSSSKTLTGTCAKP